MNTIKTISILTIAGMACSVHGNSFHSTTTDSSPEAGVYDEFYDNGLSNLAVILDEYGMAEGIKDGVIVDYTGKQSSHMGSISGIRIYKKGEMLTDIGDIYANISVDYSADEGNGEVAGLFMQKASQADGKSIYVDKINAVTYENSSSTYGISLSQTNIGDISGRGESAVISATARRWQVYGICNSSGTVGNISNLKISATGASSTASGIENTHSSSIGNISDLEIVVSGKESAYMVYGINNYDSSKIGRLENVSITVNGGTETRGISSAFSEIGALSNVKVSVSGSGFAAGIFLKGNPETVLDFLNSSEISAKSSGGSAYSIANESSTPLTLRGDSTTHTLDGNIYSAGRLTIDGNFMLKNASIEVGDSMSVSGSSALGWNGTLEIMGGDVEFADGTRLNIYLDELSLADEYLVLSSEGEITITESAIDLHVYNSENDEVFGYILEKRTDGGINQLYLTMGAVPEPAACAAIFGLAALAFSALRRKK